MNSCYKFTTRRERVAKTGPTVKKPKDAIAFAREHIYRDEGNLWRETSAILFLNSDSCVIGYEVLSEGSPSACTADVKTICRTALDVLAASVIHVHNHPSGNPLPSKADIEMGSKIRKALACLDIKLLDMLIIGESSFFSFSDETETHLNS